MTPLCKLMIDLGNQEWKPCTQKTKKGIDSKQEIFVECVELLWNLCEANDLALKVMQEYNLIALLMKHANVEAYGPRVVVAVLQCIYSVSEDLKDLKEFEHYLTSIKMRPATTTADLHMQILANGIVFNLNSDGKTASEALIPDLVASIDKVLGQDQRKLVHDYSSEIPIQNGANGNSANNDDDMVTDETTEKHESIRDEINSVILAQQTALELLTNCLCSPDDEDWEEIASESVRVSIFWEL